MSSEAPAENRTLERQAARGAFVTTGGQLVRLLVQTAGIVVLARLLTPEDYGLVAMVGVVVVLGEIFREFGLGAAAIQSPTLTRGQQDNLFWANTALGVLLFLLAQAAAVPISGFFDQPEIVEITRVLAFVFILNGAATQYRAHLTRHMRFFALTASELAAQFIGLGAGVAAALSGWGYWSLVAMQLSQALATWVFFIIASRWLPRWIDRSAEMSAFWRFGVQLLGSQLLSYGASNADTVVIGYRAGPVELGLYDRAYRLVMVPLAQMRAPTTTVALPLFSRLAGDRARYDRALLAGQLGIGYVMVPLVALLAGAHEPVVEVFLGDQWTEVAPILALLAIAGGLQLLSYVGYWVYISRALTKQLFYYSLISAGVRVLFIVVGSTWGSIGVAAGVALSAAVLWPTSLWWLSRRTEIPVRRIIGGALRILGMAAAAGLAALATVQAAAALPAVVAIGLAGLAVLGVYALGALLPFIRRDELAVVQIVRSMGSGKLRGKR